MENIEASLKQKKESTLHSGREFMEFYVKANGIRCFKKDKFMCIMSINAQWEESNIKDGISNIHNMKNIENGEDKRFKLILCL